MKHRTSDRQRGRSTAARALLAGLALAATACSSGGSTASPDPAGQDPSVEPFSAPAAEAPAPAPAVGPESATLVMSVLDLPQLGPDAVYEGWVIVDGEPVSTGRFDIGDWGEIVPEAMPAPIIGAEAASAVVVTIEPAIDLDPGPSSTKVLAGDVVAGEVELSTQHPAALGVDLSDVAGTYTLATPTDGEGNNERSGVWFIELPPGQGLWLPALPDGWSYEGWVVIGDTPVSTGRFLDPAGPDDGDWHSGPLPGPPFPGEDLLENAPAGLEFPTDLGGAAVAISVEPDPDTSRSPYALVPLSAIVPSGDGDHEILDLEATGVLPTGRGSLERP